MEVLIWKYLENRGLEITQKLHEKSFCVAH